MATLNLGRIKPVFRGAYNNSTAYVVDDIVTSGGSSYICIQASTGNAVSNATYWAQMAAGGTDVGTTLTTQGDILYRDGSGLQRLAAGTNGQALLTGGAGANPSWGTLSSDYVKLATVNASSSTSLAIDGYFTSDYQRYEIHASDVMPSADTNFWYRTYVSGSEVGSSIYNNTSGYWYTDTTPTISGGGNNNAGSQDMDAPSNYWKITGDNAKANYPCIFKIVIHDPLNTTRIKGVELMHAYFGDSGSYQIMRKYGHGVAKSTSALSGFSFHPTSGVITSGTFKLYGIK